MEAKRAMVIYSGGLDSTVSLYAALQKYSEVTALTFTYGSTHQAREFQAAEEICKRLGVKQIVVDLPFIKQHFKSNLLDNGGTSYIVPFRNGIMTSIAAGIADSNNIDTLILTTHHTDAYCFPDCTEKFDVYMKNAIAAGTASNVQLEIPFQSHPKAKIVEVGSRLNVPFELTYSCYKGGEKHCGKCPTCVERKEAFELAGINDPTEYEV